MTFDLPLQYRLYDLATGTWLGHLPFNGVTFSGQINAAGSFSGTIDIANLPVQALGVLQNTSPGRTALMIDYLGALIWGGIIWSRGYTYDGVTRVLSITGAEMPSYFAARGQATDYSAPPYSGLTGNSTTMPIWDASATDALSVYDPLLIGWQLISDVLTQVDYGDLLGGLGILANGYSSPAAYLASGTAAPETNYINQTYPFSSPQQLATMLSQLSGLGLTVGFDYAIDVAYSGLPAPVGTVNLSYPRRGRTYAENGLVVNCGSALRYTVPEDASASGNTVYEQGSSGSLVVSQNITPLTQGYPVLEQIISRSQIVSANILTVLTSLGISDLAVKSYPVATPTVTFDLFDSCVALGEFIVGDNVRWIVPATAGDGSMFDPRLPTGLDEEWRITGYTATVADEGQSTLELVLSLPPALNALNPSI